jgi:hypothetical protein
MEVSCQLHAPAALTPEERAPVSTRQDAGWAYDPVWMLLSTVESHTPAGN